MGDLLFKTKANSAAPWKGDHYRFRIFWHSLEGVCLMTFRLRMATAMRNAGSHGCRASPCICGVLWWWIPYSLRQGLIFQCNFSGRQSDPIGRESELFGTFKPFSCSISCQSVYRGYLILQAYGLRSRRFLSRVDDQQCALKSSSEYPVRTLMPFNIDWYLVNTIKRLLVFHVFE